MAILGRPPASAPLNSTDIPDNSITASKIVDGTVGVADIGANAVGTSELVDGSVTAIKVASDVATQAELDARVSTATTSAQGVGTGNSPVFSGQVRKTFVSQLSRGASTTGSVLSLSHWNTANGTTLPSASDGFSLGSVSSVIIASGESIKCTVWSFLGDWNNDDTMNLVVWANNGSSNFFMKGTNLSSGWGAPASLMFYNSVLSAGTYTFTARLGSDDPAYYGYWWGGRGIGGAQTWGAGLSEGFIQVDVIGA